MITNRIAILGGSFDPIHNAHLELAHVLRDILKFQNVAFVPCKQNPLKSDVNATAKQRVEMIELAIQPYMSHANYYCDQQELNRHSATYTLETLQAFRKNNLNASIAFTLGIDSFNSLHYWEEFEKFLDYVHLIIFPRPEHSLIRHPSLEKLIHQTKTKEIEQLHTKTHGLVYFSDIPNHIISSTQIRNELKNQNTQSIDAHIPKSVLAYITKHKLYQYTQP